MIIIPAIDILDGACVRLKQGDYQKIKKYSLDPIKVANEFKDSKAKALHLVDLDGAKLGFPINKKLILDIVKATGLPIQAGGGIRNIDTMEKYFRSGINQIILSTSVLEDKNFLVSAIKKFGKEKIIVAVDTKGRNVMKKGWLSVSEFSLKNWLKLIKNVGVEYVLATDTKRDGALVGPNFNLIKNIVDSGFQVIAAGGISTIKDLERLEKLKVYGAVIGKAIYEGKIDLREAIMNFSANNLAKRVIPCLDIKDGRVVKGTNFKRLIDVGNAVELGKKYSKDGADELVFLDINATNENRKTLIGLVKTISKNINIPFTVGGGINNIKDVQRLLNAGADKVSIGTSAVKTPSLIKKISQKYGAQCVVISIDARKYKGSWRVYVKGGIQITKVDAIDFAKNMERCGAGELLVNSLDRDGTNIGFDIELLNKISSSVNIPVIASSGAGKKSDFLEVFKKTNVDAVLAASLFHFGKLTIQELKEYLKKNKIKIRN